MSRVICLLLLFFLGCSYLSFAQEKKDKLEDEKIALRFFMDSIYPVRPILKDKVLYSDGKIWQGTYNEFVHLIPSYKSIIKICNKHYEYLDKHQIIIIIKRPKGRFKPKKWGVKRKNKDCYSYPKQDPKKNKNPRFPPSGFLNIHSMFYDSTKTEKLIAIDIIINGFSQDYKWATYAFVIKDKKIIYWRKREE